MASNSSETPETTDSPEDKLIAEIPEQEEDSSLLDSALGDVSVTEEQDNLLDDTADAVQIEDPVRRECGQECGTADIPFEAHLWPTSQQNLQMLASLPGLHPNFCPLQYENWGGGENSLWCVPCHN